MILDKLILNDFGIYQGKIEIDLTPKNKPIIIFGGNNGSGKTTLLEAIKLCLYGQRALGARTTKKDYEEFIINKIHRKRNSIIKLNSTSIHLLFNYATNSNEQRFEIVRSWKYKMGKVNELLKIYLNGNILNTISEDYWQNYIDDLLAPSIADLFFFDGEKIQSLAFDNFNEKNISNEIKRMLGIHTIEKLLVDLEIYSNKQKKENAYEDLNKKLEEEEKKYLLIESNYKKKAQELGSIQNKIDNIKGRIENIELQVSRESSGYAFKRETLKKQQIKTSLEIELLEKKLSEYVAGLLPFTLVPGLMIELKKQLQAEERTQKLKAANNILKPKIDNFKKVLNSESFWKEFNSNISTSLKNELIVEMSTKIDDLTEPIPSDTVIIHSLSEKERITISNWINEVLEETPSTIKDISFELEKLGYSLQDTTLKLQNIPDDDVLNPLLKKINSLNIELGETISTHNKIEGEKDELIKHKDDAERTVKKAYESLKVSKKMNQRLEMVQKSKEVLMDYLRETTKNKISLLEILLVKKLNILSRKQNFICKSRIDPQTYSIDLFDSEDILIPKETLSAGEKQMFAIALLWALRELSGKPFPVIIDTPLGRLDSEHRDLLVREYFPKVSHQVILFSTDSEVNQDYFKTLEPRISHTYQLIYDSESGKTNLTNGYFGESNYAN